MGKKISCAAFDLGASSGRLIIGYFDGESIRLDEIRRFSNDPVKINGRIYWDSFRMLYEMKAGLSKLASDGVNVSSLGIDTWGVDYGLLDKDGNLIAVPINYRDSRTDGMIEYADKIIPLKELYGITGIQFLGINTIFQLLSDKKIRPDILENARNLLMMPDLFGYFLTGEKYNEYTILSTSQLLDANKRELSSQIIEKLGINPELFTKIIHPGSIVGELSTEVQEETGLKGVKAVAVGSHDTASAVAGTPFGLGHEAFISCGTWSLLGVESDTPIINDESFKNNFTNEGGVENRIRFLKNINGLWIIQQLRASYGRNVKEISFEDIIAAAEAAHNKDYIINPNDSEFMNPPNMYDEICDYCVRTGQGRPDGLGEAAMAVYNGLTAEYKANVDTLEKITDKKIERINMIGGGIRDRLLCSLTAKTTGKEIVAGPVEASVLGNIIMQLKALNEISTLEEGREIINKSFERKVYI